jgi:hypothetical protein
MRTTIVDPRYLTAVALAATVMLGGCSLQRQQITDHLTPAPAVETAPPPTVRTPSADVVAFCGPSPRHPHWEAQLDTLATIGVTAVHGPCHTPPATYTVLDPGARYAPQADYLKLAAAAQTRGLGVVVYDPTFWTDPATAATVWAEYLADGTLVAVDLGDEPGWHDMAELDRRADLVRTTGATPQVIFLNGRLQNDIDQHEALPTACPTSNDYEQNAPAIMDTYNLRSAAGCAGIAIDTTGRDLDGDGDRWSISQLHRALDAGFRITLFTGVQPDNFPTWDALVDDHGRITPAGAAVREALS